MKKFLSVVLTFAMMLSMSIFAVAEEPVNVALGKNITPDGEYTNAAPYNNMTDGDVNTMGALIGGDPAVEFSLTMDLEKVYSISRIELVARAGDSAAYDLDAVTVSGVTESGVLEAICTTPPRWENQISGGDVWGYDLPETKDYRYLKLSGASIAAFACAEWRAFGKEPSTEPQPPVEEATNVAEGKVAAVNGEYQNHGCLIENMTDGNENTFAAIASLSEENFEFNATLDLEKVYSVSKIEVVARKDGYSDHDLTHFTVSGGQTPDNMEVICNTPGYWEETVIKAGETWAFHLPEAKDYRYISISGSVNNIYLFACAEFRVFGKEPSTEEPPVGEVTNVALGKNITPDGDYTNAAPYNNMTDGDVNTIGALIGNINTPVEFSLTMDLEKVYSISRIELVARKGDFSEYDLDAVTVSGVTESGVIEAICTTPPRWENTLSGGDVWGYDLPKAKNYRYLKLSGASYAAFACAEWRAFGKEPSTEPPVEEDTNIALNKNMDWTGELDFLSNLEAYGPAKLVDGDNTTFTAFAGKTGGTPYELRVDLGDYYDISKVELESRSNMDNGWEVGGVTISGSTAEVPAAQMTALATTPSGYPPETAVKPGEVFTHMLAAPQRFRYITLSGTTPDGFMFACAELRVFGKKASVPEAQDVNIAVGKPLTYTEGLKFYEEGDYGAKNINDGNDATAALAFAPASATYFYKIDLLNFYDISAIELPSRTEQQGWADYDLANITVLGSIANVPVDQMEVISATPAANEGGVPAGETWRYDLPTTKKYRYIALKITSPAEMPSFIKEVRVLSKAETDFGEWIITEKESGASQETIEAGKTYTASISITNYARLETSDYIMILGGYDADGFMTVVRCAKTPVPGVGSAGTLSTEVTLPAGTVRLSAVLVDGFNNAMMVVDSKDLFVAEGAE